MASKNNRRTTMTKRLLKESLFELLKEKPISRISVKELCEVADLNRSTFYLHYSDQYELLAEVENEVVEKTAEYLKNVSNGIYTPNYISAFLGYIKDNASVFSILLTQPEHLKFQDTLIKEVLGDLKEGLPLSYKGLAKDYAFNFMVHGSLQIIRDWINSSFELPTEEIAGLIYSACSAVCASK